MPYNKVEKTHKQAENFGREGGILMLLDTISLVLVIVGALNWGSIGLFGVDLVSSIFGVGSILSRIIFSLVGIAGLWSITILFKDKVPMEHHD